MKTGITICMLSALLIAPAAANAGQGERRERRGERVEHRGEGLENGSPAPATAQQ